MEILYHLHCDFENYGIDLYLDPQMNPGLPTYLSGNVATENDSKIPL